MVMTSVYFNIRVPQKRILDPFSQQITSCEQN